MRQLLDPLLGAPIEDGWGALALLGLNWHGTTATIISQPPVSSGLPEGATTRMHEPNPWTQRACHGPLPLLARWYYQLDLESQLSWYQTYYHRTLSMELGPQIHARALLLFIFDNALARASDAQKYHTNSRLSHCRYLTTDSLSRGTRDSMFGFQRMQNSMVNARDSRFILVQVLDRRSSNSSTSSRC